MATSPTGVAVPCPGGRGAVPQSMGGRRDTDAGARFWATAVTRDTGRAPTASISAPTIVVAIVLAIAFAIVLPFWLRAPVGVLGSPIRRPWAAAGIAITTGSGIVATLAVVIFAVIFRWCVFGVFWIVLIILERLEAFLHRPIIIVVFFQNIIRIIPGRPFCAPAVLDELDGIIPNFRAEFAGELARVNLLPHLSELLPNILKTHLASQW